jgi:hypothetical protein
MPCDPFEAGIENLAGGTSWERPLPASVVPAFAAGLPIQCL